MIPGEIVKYSGLTFNVWILIKFILELDQCLLIFLSVTDPFKNVMNATDPLPNTIPTKIIKITLQQIVSFYFILLIYGEFSEIKMDYSLFPLFYFMAHLILYFVIPNDKGESAGIRYL